MPKEKPIKELYEQYLVECEYTSRLRPDSIRGYKAVFKLFTQLVPEVITPRFLTTEMVVIFFKRLQDRTRKVGRDTYKKGVQSSTILTYWNKLSAFFEWLNRNGHIAEHPLRKLNPPRVEITDSSRHISNDNVKKIYTAIVLQSKNLFTKKRDIAMVSLLFYCGLRLGEFLSLEVLDIDFESQVLTVKSNTSKSKRKREIPLHPILNLHLKEYLTERNKQGYKTQYLIVSTKTEHRLTKHGLKHWVKNLKVKSEVEFHLHQFRHAFAYNLAINDVNAVKIQKLLGHKSLNMTMRYLESIETKELEKEVKKIQLY